MSTVNTYVGDGLQKNFTFSFPYLSPSHVRVFVNDGMQLQTMHYELVGNTIYFNDAPLAGDAVEIKRTTSPSDPLVDFTDGSTLKADELDIAYLHNFYLSQEYADSFTKMLRDALNAIAGANGLIEMPEPDEIIAVLVNEMLNSANAANLQARISDIDTNAEAIITLGEALQVQINTLAQGVAANVYVQATEPVPGVGDIPNPIPEGSRWYDADDNNKPYIYLDGVWTSIEDPRVGQAVSDISVLQTDVNGNAAAIVNEAFARSTQDSAFASTLALLGVQNAGATAFIIDSNTVKLDSDVGDTLANRFSQLSAADGGLQAQITAEQTARIGADGALASSINLLTADVGSNAAAILAEQTTRAGADSALAFDITALTASVGDNTAAVLTNASALADVAGGVATLEARYGVTLNVNDHITGFAQHNDGKAGSFIIVANKFAVVAPGGGTPRVPFEIVGTKINLRGDVSIDGSLVLNGTLVGSALVAGTIGSTHIGPNSITTDKLNANAVTAAKIAALAITAEKINVTSLSAISANLGTVTAGTIQLPTTGWIKGGQSSFHNGVGFFLGYESNAYKFSLGNSTTGNYLTWDGSTLTIKGDLFVGEYVASDTIRLQALTERYHYPPNPSYTEVKRFTIDRAGTVRLTFDVSEVNASTGRTTTAMYSVKRGGSIVASGVITGSYSTKSHDVLMTATDQTLTLEIRNGNGNASGEPWFSIAYLRNARVRCDVTIPADGGTVNTD